MIDVRKLTPGDVVAQNVYDRNRILLISKDKQLTAENIRALQVYGFHGLYIQDEISKGIETAGPISDQLMSNVLSSLSALDIDAIIENSREMVKQITNNLFVNDMRMLKDYDDYTLRHSVSVAIFAAVLAKSLCLTDSEVENVVQAGLLHDIGKLKVPIGIIDKAGTLTDAEFEEIKKHPGYGYDQLKNRSDIWSVVRVGILQHHENEDGSGYPRGLTGNRISKVGKILHIADVYDALTTKRSYKEEWSAKDAMHFLQENSKTMFDPIYVNVFTKCIPLYRKGTIVKLSNGADCIIVRNNARNSKRPVVRLLDTKEEIDLLTNPYYRFITIIS